MKTLVVMLLTLVVSAILQAEAKAKCGPTDADWWQQADSHVREHQALSKDVRVARGQDDSMNHEPRLKYQSSEDDDEEDDEDEKGDGGGPDRLWDAVSLG